MIKTGNRFQNIKLLLFDLQGVLLPNGSELTDSQLEQFYKTMINFCEFAKANDFYVAIITANNDISLKQRICSNCVCDILSANIDKIPQSDKLLNKYNITYDNVFYMGDDLLDIPLLKKAALSAAPEKARREVKRVVDFICRGNDGEERLKFIIESILNEN